MSWGTPLDESNVRKAFSTILDKAELHMRHTFASLLFQAGEPITYISRQVGHKDIDHAKGVRALAARHDGSKRR